MNVIKIFTIFCLGLMFALQSCESFIDISVPRNEITSEDLFSDSTNADAALIGLYVGLAQGTTDVLTGGGMTLLTGLVSDELVPLNTSIIYEEFYFNDISRDNHVNSTSWRAAYSLIYSANACIEGLEASQGISESARNTLLAEARYLRSFVYFYLLQVYGNVPLVISTDYRLNKLLPQTPSDVIYKQIIQDLEFAQSHFPKARNNPNRANYYTATALLAKVQLFVGNYASAVEESSKVIESDMFNLEPHPKDVFVANSSETIWSILPLTTFSQTSEGLTFIPASPTTLPRYVLNEDLLYSFEANDARRTSWVMETTVNGETYTYPNKYRVGYVTEDSGRENYVVIRLAELFLIRAEAKMSSEQMNDLKGAIDDLNVIRKRAGLTELSSTLTHNSVRELIQKERRVELAFEWGNRWMDLQRWGIISEVLQHSKPQWNPSRIWFPIPQNELDINPNLK